MHLKRIKMAFVGLHFGGMLCDEVMKHPELPIEITHVCDLDFAKAQEVADRYGLTPVHNLDEMLNDPSIEAVGLFTGPNGRANLVRQIIRAGKDVMTTKPFERGPETARAVLEEAKHLGRVVHINSPNPRARGQFAIIKEWVDAGLIGRPTLLHSDVWCYYGPTAADGSWYDDPAQCPVAPFFRLGIYALNDLLSILGEPISVQVSHSRVETQRPTPDNASVTITFADGVIANFMASFVVGGVDTYKQSITIGGTEGVIYSDVGPKSRGEQSVSTVTLSRADRVETKEVHERSGDYDWEFFARRVRGEVFEDDTPIDTIVKAIRVMQAVSQAELSGETVHLNSNINN